MSYIGNIPVPQATQTRDRFTATSGQTTFATSGYTPGFLDVYLNGVHLDASDYTATNGSDVVLDTGAATDDIVEVVAFTAFEIAKLYNTATDTTGFFALPSGTTAQRPSPAAAGYSRFNSDTETIEFFDGTNWISTNLIPTVDSVTGTIYAGAASDLTLALSNATDTITVRFSEGGLTVADVSGVTVTSDSATVTVPSAVFGQTAGDTIAVSVLNSDGIPSSNAISKTVVGLPTGGTITTYGDYRVHTFLTTADLIFPTGFSATVESLIVAGGGGGGGGSVNGGGGGGAGGFRTASATITAGTYTATVGSGGSAGSGQGGNGNNSSFNSVTSIGGGGGGTYTADGSSGGSGGGTGRDGSTTTSGAGTSGQGFRGGFAGVGCGSAGGGGGASEVGYTGEYDCGSSFANPNSSAGGDGLANDYRTGSNITYAGGGGGAYEDAPRASYGGAGGGGTGGSRGGITGGNGSANTGGGGGGGQGGYAAGSGGSGIVVVRYAL